MKTNEKKLGAEHLMADIALLLLRESNPKGALKDHLDKKRSEIITRYGKEGFQRLMVCQSVMARVVEKLVACESEEEVVKTLYYVDAINTADIYIAAEGQEIIVE